MSITEGAPGDHAFYVVMTDCYEVEQEYKDFELIRDSRPPVELDLWTAMALQAFNVEPRWDLFGSRPILHPDYLYSVELATVEL